MSKTLKEIVKQIQFFKDWTIEQVAKSIGYSRVHLMKEMKKDDNEALKNLLLDAHKDILQNVSSKGIKDDSWEPSFDDLIEEKAILKTVVNHILKLEAIVYERKLEDVRRDFNLDTNLILDELTGGAASKP